MIRIRTLIISAAALLWVLPPGMAAPPVAGDLQRMEGTWTLKYAEKGNKPLSTNELKATSVRITGGIFYILVDGKVVNDARLTVDSAKEPKHLNMASPDGRQSAMGIYQFESDELRLCWDNRPGERPAIFRGVNESGSLVYFRLVKAPRQVPEER